MNLDTLLVAIDAFLRDARLYVILALILADVVFGLAHALKAGTFSWYKLADFYRTMVVPFVMGYLVLYVLVKLSIGFEAFFGQAAVMSAFGTITLHLVASIVGHAKAIGFSFSEGRDDPYVDVPEM